MDGTLPGLPGGYYLERDPDWLVLRRADGSLVARFSDQGAAPETVRWAAEEAVHGEEFTGPGLRAKFFGRFELIRNGEAIPLGRNGKALAILKYLLTRRARPVPQDHLMGWLWPDSDLKRARWSLNSTVHALRKLLSSYLPALSTSEILLFEGGRYRLSPHIALSTDVDEFDAYSEKGRRLERTGRGLEAVVEYERATELYQDDYLTEDLYEEWTAIERERLSDAYTDLSRRLAIYYMETGQLQEGVRTCYRILEKDRCDEDTHRLLMECFVRLGRRARALRQYRLCEGRLRQDYGMAPSPETRALHASILKDGSASNSVAFEETASPYVSWSNTDPPTRSMQHV